MAPPFLWNLVQAVKKSKRSKVQGTPATNAPSAIVLVGCNEGLDTPIILSKTNYRYCFRDKEVNKGNGQSQYLLKKKKNYFSILNIFLIFTFVCREDFGIEFLFLRLPILKITFCSLNFKNNIKKCKTIKTKKKKF